jgi:3-(3-hydroxy-phenyl)propionate hydroxylase
VLEFNLEELNEDLEFPYRLQCEQHKFARMFASKLENHENAEVLFNHEVISFYQENGSVNVDVKNFENSEEFKCDFFIGADGSNSIVRRNLGLEFSGFTYQEKFLTLSTTHDIQGYFNNLSYVNYVSDPKEWFVLLKAPSAWRMLVPVDEELDDEYIVSDEFIDKIFEKILKVSNKISTVHRTIYRVHQRVVDKMNHDRILLAGDSAHINNPLGGFGMNGGLHDAWNLAGKLDAIINSCANHNLLDLYDRQRRTIMNDFIQAQTIRNKRMIEETGDNNSTSEWNRMRDIHSDEEKRKEYMLRQSMTQSIKKQGEIV